MKTKFIVILTTCKNRKEAISVTDSLLKKRMIACANIVSGIESKFWWDGKIDKAKEILILVKARVRDFDAIEKEIKRLHSYKVPEIVALPILKGSRPYLNWIDSSVISCGTKGPGK
jgi:periplasmic divalent cation tolerance protein